MSITFKTFAQKFINFSLYNSNKINFFLIMILYIIPLSLVTGPFLPDLCLTIIAIYGLFKFIKKFEIIFNELKFFIITFGIFFIILINSSIFSEEITYNLLKSFTYLRYLFFTIGCYMLLVNNKENIFYYFYNWILITYFIVCFDAIFQYFFGVNTLAFPTDNRLSGFFRDELILGSYLSRLLPFLIGLYFLSKSNNFKTLIFLILITNIVVILAKERAAFLFILMTDTICIFILFKKIKYKFLILLISAILISTFLIFEKNSYQRIFNTSLEQFNEKVYKPNIFIKYLPYSNDHEKIFYSAILMIKDDWLTGHGPNQFREICQNYNHIKYTSCNTHPHNTYLQIFSETGVLGILFIILLFNCLIYFFAKFCKVSKKNYFIKSNIFILLSILITLWPLIPSGNFFNNWLGVIYFLPIPFFLFLNKKINFY